ncbi:MAG: hypothetical protein Q4P78_02670 [Rothia sp. (in: high G+C Gram-positive bacteria)]|uniref:hypothetical protein n=1 Tax=Rothia sp. (in: high G+C Gram-positive bacteria) TaxID=1885016 RepID=UPI0026DFBFE7|nr:hypothetical protein [Rothia sp. (in: high G+C Gram-positive bacteria)]MDO5750092.1 hypothetical protein [Rothia sp. (in: high G+C Gram-positive bacteria)]
MSLIFTLIAVILLLGAALAWIAVSSDRLVPFRPVLEYIAADGTGIADDAKPQTLVAEAKDSSEEAASEDSDSEDVAENPQEAGDKS